MPHTEAGLPPQCHTIGFFHNDRQLAVEVATFVVNGLVADQPALVVTNAAHREGICHELAAHGVDIDHQIAAGNLLLLDAEATLAAIMRGDLPDEELYDSNVTAVVKQLLRGRPGPVRIFGDMVDLLWQRQQYDAAIRIEMLSNKLAVVQPISVICGYSMGHFLKTATKLELVTRLHGAVHKTRLTPRHASVPERRSGSL